MTTTKEIDWSKFKSGDWFTAKIQGVKCVGKIHKSQTGYVFLCQNKKGGADSPNKRGYKFSWSIYHESAYGLTTHNVTNLKLYKSNPMAKKVVKKKSDNSVVKIKTITGATWHIGKEKKGLSTKLVAANGYVNRYDKGFNNKQNAMKNIYSSIRNGIIDDGVFIEALVSAKTREEVIMAISHYGYLKPKKVAAKKAPAKKTAAKKKK